MTEDESSWALYESEFEDLSNCSSKRKQVPAKASRRKTRQSAENRREFVTIQPPSNSKSGKCSKGNCDVLRSWTNSNPKLSQPPADKGTIQVISNNSNTNTL